MYKNTNNSLRVAHGVLTIALEQVAIGSLHLQMTAILLARLSHNGLSDNFIGPTSFIVYAGDLKTLSGNMLCKYADDINILVTEILMSALTAIFSICLT